RRGGMGDGTARYGAAPRHALAPGHRGGGPRPVRARSDSRDARLVTPDARADRRAAAARPGDARPSRRRTRTVLPHGARTPWALDLVSLPRVGHGLDRDVADPQVPRQR